MVWGTDCLKWPRKQVRQCAQSVACIGSCRWKSQLCNSTDFVSWGPCLSLRTDMTWLTVLLSLAMRTLCSSVRVVTKLLAGEWICGGDFCHPHVHSGCRPHEVVFSVRIGSRPHAASCPYGARPPLNLLPSGYFGSSPGTYRSERDYNYSNLSTPRFKRASRSSPELIETFGVGYLPIYDGI
jgi:hypothetical protein